MDDTSLTAVSEGYIDHVFEVLSKHIHPFILVGISAHRWMGCSGFPDAGFDLLIQDNQLSAVADDLLATGKWKLYQPSEAVECFDKNPFYEDHVCELLVKYCRDADIALFYTCDLNGEFAYVRLWSETTYKMKVDKDD